MKATLEFTLPEDEADWHIFQQAKAYHRVLCELNVFLRGKVKYPDPKTPPAVTKAFLEVRMQLHEELSAEGVDLDV